MSDKWIKKSLLNSSTMPMGTGGAPTTGQWLMGSAAQSHGHDHDHKADGSCCGHDHAHDHHHHDHDDEDEDCTNPSGGCC